MPGAHELQEVPIDSSGCGDKQLQESALADTMAAVGGIVTGLGSLYYTRAQYLLARNDHDTEYETLRNEFEARYEAERLALEIEYRALYAEMRGLDAMNRFDGFGSDDDDYSGFGVE